MRNTEHTAKASTVSRTGHAPPQATASPHHPHAWRRQVQQRYLPNMAQVKQRWDVYIFALVFLSVFLVPLQACPY